MPRYDMRLTPSRLSPLAALPLALLLSGCPYESSEPLSPPGEASLDVGLVGPWTCRMSEEEQDVRVTFLAFDDRQYALLWEQKGEAPAVLRAHRGELGGVSFLNFQVLDPPDRPQERSWSFARYTRTGGSLTFEAIEGEAFPKAMLPADLRAAVAKRASDASLYEPLAQCRKIPDEE